MKKRPKNRRIVVANHKGGVGKTTTAVNVAASLAEHEDMKDRVLLIDLDPQGNASEHLGVRENKRPGTYRVVIDEEPLRDVVVKTPFGIHVLTGGDNNVVIESSLAHDPDLAERLSKALDDCEDDYDAVIIDVPPMITHVLKAAMLAVDGVVAPMTLEGMSERGLAKLLDTIEKQRKNNRRLDLLGVIEIRSDPRHILSREVKARLQEAVGNVLLDTRIRQNTPLARAFDFAQPITAFDTECFGAADYRALTAEMIVRGIL